MEEIQIMRYARAKNNKLTLSMTIHNEADNYLKSVLEAHAQYIDEAVIIDDASTDNSVEICYEVLRGIPLHIVHNPVSRFSNEVELRKQQWEETVKTNPDWILNVDADHMFETKFKDEVRNLIDQMEYDVISFRLYDFWDETHFRDDQYWMGHKTYRTFLTRYQPQFPYVWKESPQHCGHFPANIYQLPNTISEMRLKHFGWANPKTRIDRYERYLKLDPELKWGWKEQINSIMDENPNLVEWVE